MDERLKISKKAQIEFFTEIKNKGNLTLEELGKLCGVTGRAVRDWNRAKYTLPYKIALLLSAKFKVRLPVGYKLEKRYWYIEKYARKGALARQKLHGLLGNIETRRKGGQISQLRRKENPEKYRKLGCIVKKDFKPLNHSVELAELCGILLGDGCITNSQVTVTLNKVVDKKYADYVYDLIKKVTDARPYCKERSNVIVLVLSGVGLVENLEKLGLKRGNKVKNQIGIPEWIYKSKEFSYRLIRGLMDTDGCVYAHHHIVRGVNYTNIGMNFSNRSQPLIHGVYNILKGAGIKSSMVEQKGVWIYSLREVKKYFCVIGSSNPKHIDKLENLSKLKILIK